VKQSFKGWDASVLAHQSIIAENKARIYRSISSPKVETTPEGARRNEADLQASGNNLSAALLRKNTSPSTPQRRALLGPH